MVNGEVWVFFVCVFEDDVDCVIDVVCWVLNDLVWVGLSLIVCGKLFFKLVDLIEDCVEDLGCLEIMDSGKLFVEIFS